MPEPGGTDIAVSECAHGVHINALQIRVLQHIWLDICEHKKTGLRISGGLFQVIRL